MLKIGCFKQNHCISGMPQGIPMQFLFNSDVSQFIVSSFTHIHSGLQQNLFFKFINCWKMLKMLKIGCFKQNHCITVMPQGILMQFFAQQ